MWGQMYMCIWKLNWKIYWYFFSDHWCKVNTCTYVFSMVLQVTDGLRLYPYAFMNPPPKNLSCKGQKLKPFFRIRPFNMYAMPLKLSIWLHWNLMKAWFSQQMKPDALTLKQPSDPSNSEGQSEAKAKNLLSPFLLLLPSCQWYPVWPLREHTCECCSR